MGKDRIQKIKSFIKSRKKKRQSCTCKFQSYLEKHHINPQSVVLGKHQSLLHYSCKHGNHRISSFLLKAGLCPFAQDKNGNLPLHLALKRAITMLVYDKSVYKKIILPQLEKYPGLLHMANKENVTCQQLLTELVTSRCNNTQKSCRKSSSTDQGGGASHFQEMGQSEEEEDEWNRKLFEEFYREQDDMYGNDYYGGSFNEETHEEWADRLSREMNAKRRYDHSSAHQQGNRRKHQKRAKTMTDEEEKLKKAREEMEKKYKKHQKEDKKNRYRLKKKSYNDKMKKLFSKECNTMLSFHDIPWPCLEDASDLRKVLFCDIPDGDKEQCRKYLREQQVCWHPDKFVQKLGHRLQESDRDSILQQVKTVSQHLNKLSDDMT